MCFETIFQLFGMHIAVFNLRTNTTPWNTIFSQSDNHLSNEKWIHFSWKPISQQNVETHIHTKSLKADN